MACRHEQAAHEPGHVPVCCGAREPHLPCAQSAWGQHAAGGLGRQWPPEPGSLGSLHLWHGSLPGVQPWSSIAPRSFFLNCITCLLMHHALRQHQVLKATCCCCLLSYTACIYDSIQPPGYPFTAALLLHLQQSLPSKVTTLVDQQQQQQCRAMSRTPTHQLIMCRWRSPRAMVRWNGGRI